MTAAAIEAGGSAQSAARPKSAGPPLGVAPAARVGALLAVAVIALGVLGVRDAVVGLGWAAGRPWIPMAAGVLDGQRPTWWTGAASIAVGALGVALLAVAVLPRRRRGMPVVADTAVFVGCADVAAVAAAAARDVPGVLRVRVGCSPRRVRVRCLVTPEDRSDVEAAITAALTNELSVLRSVPRIVVHTRTETRS